MLFYILWKGNVQNEFPMTYISHRISYKKTRPIDQTKTLAHSSFKIERSHMIQIEFDNTQNKIQQKRHEWDQYWHTTGHQSKCRSRYQQGSFIQENVGHVHI